MPTLQITTFSGLVNCVSADVYARIYGWARRRLMADHKLMPGELVAKSPNNHTTPFNPLEQDAGAGSNQNGK